MVWHEYQSDKYPPHPNHCDVISVTFIINIASMQQMFQEICLSFQTVVSFAFELPMNGKQATEV